MRYWWSDSQNGLETDVGRGGAVWPGYHGVSRRNLESRFPGRRPAQVERLRQRQYRGPRQAWRDHLQRQRRPVQGFFLRRRDAERGRVLPLLLHRPVPVRLLRAALHSYGASIHADDRLARLFDIAYPNKGLGDFYDGTSSSSFGKFSSGIFSSAFQLALWEIFYETSANLSLADGSFLSSTTANSSGTTEQQAVAQAQQWLTQVQGGAGSAAGWTLYKFTSATQQDYLSAVYREPPQITLNAVPEPGTLALLGFGVAALGALRRRA